MFYQNYNHYKLPITINPLEYGRLIYNLNNIYFVWITTRTIAVISQNNNENNISFYRDGILIFTYKDQIIYQDTDTILFRFLNNYKFTFLNSKLINKALRIIKNFWNNSNWLKWIKERINYLLKNYKPELFILFKISLVFFLWLLIYVIFPNDSSDLLALAALKPKFYKNTFNSVYYNIKNKVFSLELIEGYFNKFWKTVSPKLLEDAHIYILLKIQFEDGNIHTIGKLIRIDNENNKTFIEIIMNYLEGMGDYYKQSPLVKLVFNYGYGKGKITEALTKSEIKLIDFKDMKLPISIIPSDYGKIISVNKTEIGNIYTIYDNLGRIVIFEETDTKNNVTYFKNGHEILSFIDKKFEENKFLRKLGNKSLFFENGDKTIELLDLNTPYISKLKKDKVEINNIITLDVETMDLNGILSPYLISFYDGIKSYSFYLSDYNSIDLMMEDCFNNLFVRKYDKFSIYVHNLAKFDIIFLMKYLIKQVKVKPLIHKGRIIQLNVNYGPNSEYKVRIKDSYLILLTSLEKLSKTFSTEIQKSVFPHKFVNENNLNYIGEVPSILNFFKITENEYNNYKNSFNLSWNMKNEAIKYCEKDVISLYQSILKFNSLIFSLFGKNIHNYPTLPSLAFGVFRSIFMDTENIPKLTGNIEKDIREGYTGGSTDMFIPYGKNIKCYDVNSLYPSVMINKDMPIGKPVKFNGDITKTEVNPFGFFKVNVIAPENIKHPILQIRHKTKGGIKTISPLGSWTMWIFSEEMYNAQNFGYQFKILEGYLFERGVVFKDYVESLYGLRLTHSKSDPMNYIAKILLNSLYGRFGMGEINVSYEFFSKTELTRINIENIIDIIEFDESVLVGLKTETIEDNSNISISVASAITAYSRIHMSQFKNNPDINLFYSDTDSIYTDSELDPSFIDSKILGKLKLEYLIDEAVFLGPKSYCLKLENGETVVKIKGLKNTENLTLNDFKDLLVKDFFINRSHKKWFRDLDAGKITIKEQLYRIQKLESKRVYIYENNILVKTKSIKLNE